jgi:hypothetical protein
MVALSLFFYPVKHIIEALKMELVKSRFENIDEDDLVDGNTFLDEIDSGEYD